VRTLIDWKELITTRRSLWRVGLLYFAKGARPHTGALFEHAREVALMASCAYWVSTCQNGRCRVSLNDTHGRVRKRGGRSSRISRVDRFFTVPTLTGRVLFVLAVLSHHRRHIVHLNIADHPTAKWSAQQVVDAFPDDTAPRWLHRDRDRIYGAVFRHRLAGMGIGEVVSAPASPWQKDYASYSTSVG
jgi:hypothetical protein